jgi:hypothetical protein
MKNTITRSSETATRVKRTAQICGVTARAVYMVIFGDRVNEKILRVYMHLEELEKAAFDIAKKTSLVKNVEAVVPFNN